MKAKARRVDRRSYNLGVRAESAEATGTRIVDAFLARLMTQWFDEITLDRVAADAGVTVQTVVRRFGGKEGLLAAAVGTLAEQINARRALPPEGGERQVDSIVADYEESGDAVIRLLALEQRLPAVRKVTDYGRAEHRRWVSAAYAKALEKLDASGRRSAIDALVVGTDVYTWKLLRRDMGRSAEATVSTIKGLIRGTVAEFTNPKSRGGNR